MDKVAFYFFISSFVMLYAQSVTLENILSYASKHALTLQIKKMDALIESKNIESAESAYYPTLDLVYNNEYTESLDGIPLGTESVGGITISNGTRYQNTVAVQLNYHVFQFGVTEKAVESALMKAEIKDNEWCQEEKRLHLKIVDIYADALKQKNEKIYRSEMLKIRKDLYNLKERLYRAGEYSKVDLGDEAIYIITLQRDIENAIMQYKEDIIRLSQLSLMKLSPLITILEPFRPSKEQNDFKPFESTIDAIILQKQISQKEAEILLQYREQFPSISLYSNYYMYSSDPKKYNYPITHLRQKSWNIGFSIRFNIFEGFKHSAKYEQLKLEVQKLRLQYEEAKHNFVSDIESKKMKIFELGVLREQESKLIEKTEKKLIMIDRLRKHHKVDRITQLNNKYELQERILTLKNREVDTLKEKIALQISQRGVQECTQH